MSFWSWITGGTESVNKIIDGVSKGVDKAFFTQEEKADYNKGLLDFTIKYLESTQPQNVSRRVISFVIVALWALFLLMAVALHPFMPEYSNFIFKTVKDNINQPFEIIIGFYFLTQFVRNLSIGKKE